MKIQATHMSRNVRHAFTGGSHGFEVETQADAVGRAQRLSNGKQQANIELLLYNCVCFHVSAK